jgi:hypothetical protein
MIRSIVPKGLPSLIMFVMLATLIEALVVLYSLNLGVVDPAALRISWPLPFTVSPLFHLIPIAVIIILVLSWQFLTRKLAAKGPEIRPGKTETRARRTELKQKAPKTGQSARSSPIETKPAISKSGEMSLLDRIRSARASIISALVVLLGFLSLALTVSLFVYPQMVYQAATSMYRNNPSLFSFVISLDNSIKGFADAAAPLGWIGATMNNALFAIAPAVRDSGLGLGVIGSLANLDNEGKYLAFQNVAAWISALFILFYGEYARKPLRYRKK